MLSAGSAAGVATSGTLVSINNGSFEVPTLAAGTFQYGPTGSNWNFSAGAGVSSNGSGFTSANPNAPNGTQVAFLQGTGIMTQSVYLDVGAYSISFLAAQRVGQSHPQMIYITVDGNRVAYATPTSTNYAPCQTANFSIATAGMHTILFKGLNPQGGDNTAFLDNVGIQVAASAISDGSFEAPGLVAKTYQYGPDGSPWQFTGGAVSSNGSGFTLANSSAPDGTQVGVLQGNGSISQSVYLDAGTYAISLQAVQRASHQAHYQQIGVLVDGAQVGAIIPSSKQYTSYETSGFPVATAGVHTIRFVGLNPLGGDNTAFLDTVAISAVNPVSDNSFEVPGLAAGTFQYAPTGSLWQFAAGAGVSSNGSGFTSANPNAPSGTQVAFLQNTGSMSQSVYLNIGGYSVSFQAAQRGACQAHSQQIEVLVDGNRVGYVTPSGTSYGTYQTTNFPIATAGMHTVRFAGLNPQGGDNTALLDNVTIVSRANSISDASFEVPVLAVRTFQYLPDGSPWQFTTGGGVTSDDSTFNSANPNAPNGTQVAFLQNAGSMSQSVYLDAGNYAISFQAAQRGISQASYQQLAVLVDGVQIGLITPSGTKYALYQTPSFPIATAGLHAIQFLGVNPQGGDNTAFLDTVSIAKASPISDGNFEVPGLTAGTYQYQPTGSLWQFAGTAGMSSNNSDFTSANPTAPSGSQVAFVQGTGSISQSVYLGTGTYTLSFQAAQRAGVGQTNTQQIGVLVDGAQVGLITPSSTKYALYQTPSLLIATAGMHTIQFLGLDPQGGNNTAFLDNIQIAAA